MDELFVIFGLISRFICIGSILGWVAFFRIRSLHENNHQLQQEVKSLKRLISIPTKPPAISVSESLPTNVANSELTVNNSNSKHSTTQPDVNWYKELQGNKPDNTVAPIKTINESDDINTKAAANAAAWNNSTNSGRSRHNKKESGTSFFEKLFKSVSSHWMIWVGGASIGFAGVFLVKYSVDNNLLALKQGFYCDCK